MRMRDAPASADDDQSVPWRMPVPAPHLKKMHQPQPTATSPLVPLSHQCPPICSRPPCRSLAVKSHPLLPHQPPGWAICGNILSSTAAALPRLWKCPPLSETTPSDGTPDLWQAWTRRQQAGCGLAWPHSPRCGWALCSPTEISPDKDRVDVTKLIDRSMELTKHCKQGL